jgi:hypothetical protein
VDGTPFSVPVFLSTAPGMKAVYLYSCLVGIVILVGYYKSKGVFMKKLLVILILLLISGIVFADEYVAVEITNRTTNAFVFSFSNKDYGLLSDTRYNYIALALLCNYMDSNGFEFIQMEKGDDLSSSYLVLFRKKQ